MNLFTLQLFNYTRIVFPISLETPAYPKKQTAFSILLEQSIIRTHETQFIHQSIPLRL